MQLFACEGVQGQTSVNHVQRVDHIGGGVGCQIPGQLAPGQCGGLYQWFYYTL